MLVRRETQPPISAYALLGDGASCALVDDEGDVDWWALPTMADAPPFGALLDLRAGGRLALRPDAEFEKAREYLEGTGVLVTTYRTATGVVRVLDALTIPDDTHAWVELVRRIEGVDGEVPMVWTVNPGDRFSTAAAWMHVRGELPLITLGTLNIGIVADGVGRPDAGGGGVSGRFTTRAGSTSMLGIVATQNAPVPAPTRDELAEHLDSTLEQWQRWRADLQCPGPWTDAVCRSAIVLKQLTYAPSGAIQAAATTSLPERIGSDRNYDYRYCWVRDASFALDALTRLGLRREVHETLTALLTAVENSAPAVQVFYSIAGDPVTARQETVPLWDGYRGSGPVRIGNSAVAQRQLGVYGDLLECVHRYVERRNVLDGGTARLIHRIAEQVCREWNKPDAGIWELEQERLYTISKIGCWTALDRAIKLAERGQVPADAVPSWRRVAAEIREFVNAKCWSSAKSSYAFYAGSDDLDCATLLAARTGFCRGDESRLNSTIDAICHELSAGGHLLYRYSGMRGKEGAFIACSFWLVEALAHVNRLDEAEAAMCEMVERANDVGLLSEEIDPDSGELLGNFPQALSHLALISAAAAVADAAAGRER